MMKRAVICLDSCTFFLLHDMRKKGAGVEVKDFQGYLTLLEEEKKADVEADLVIWRVESGAEQKEELKQ